MPFAQVAAAGIARRTHVKTAIDEKQSLWSALRVSDKKQMRLCRTTPTSLMTSNTMDRIPTRRFPSLRQLVIHLLKRFRGKVQRALSPADSGQNLAQRSEALAPAVDLSSIHFSKSFPTATDNISRPSTAVTVDILSVATWEAKGRIDRAIDECRRILEAHPDSFDIWFHKARLHSSLGEIVPASRAYLKAIELRPNDPWVHFGYGMLAAATARLALAITHLKQGLELDPSADEIRINLCATYALGGRPSDAFHVLKPFEGRSLPGWWAKQHGETIERHSVARKAALDLFQRHRRSAGLRQSEDELIDALIRLGRLRAARTRLLTAMRAQPVRIDLFERYAHVLDRIAPGAGTEFLMGLDWIVGDQPAYRAILGSAFAADGRYRDCLEQLSGIDTATWTNTTHQSLCFALLFEGRGRELVEHSARWAISSDEITAHRFLLCGLRTLGHLKLFDEDFARSNRPVTSDSPPRHIIQFWDSKPIPPDVSRAMASWDEFNPDYTRIVFDASAALDFLIREFGDLAGRCFVNCRHPAMKSDLFRIAYILKHGGFYVDADEVCLRSLEPIRMGLSGKQLIVTMSSDIAPYLHNYFIGAPPDSAPLQRFFKTLLEHFENDTTSWQTGEIWELTGPGRMTRTVSQWLYDHPGSADVAFMSERQYRSFAKTDDQLLYKHDPALNWRLN